MKSLTKFKKLKKKKKFPVKLGWTQAIRFHDVMSSQSRDRSYLAQIA